MKYYIIAGEASGDLHASNLIKNIKKFDVEAVFRGWGGDLMLNTGVTIVKHIRDLAFMGLVEVLANIRTIKKNFSFCQKDIIEYKPDVLILVDYPGFNLRIAKFARKNGIRIFYYISPTVWAWHQSRVEQVRKYVDKMYAILPFEKEFYKKFNIEIEYAGHPLLDAITDYTKTKISYEDFCLTNHLTKKPLVAIVPGSRKQEIKRKLPIMLAVAEKFPDYDFVITGAPSIEKEYYDSFLKGSEIPVLFNQTYTVLSYAHAAMVTSGTATVETALFNVPQVVCYKTNPLTFIIAKTLVKIKYISLVNLILKKLAIVELIQGDLTVNNLSREMEYLMKGERREQMLKDYTEFNNLLGGPGASERIAKLMVNRLSA